MDHSEGHGNHSAPSERRVTQQSSDIRHGLQGIPISAQNSDQESQEAAPVKASNSVLGMDSQNGSEVSAANVSSATTNDNEGLNQSADVIQTHEPFMTGQSSAASPNSLQLQELQRRFAKIPVVSEYEDVAEDSVGSQLNVGFVESSTGTSNITSEEANATQEGPSMRVARAVQENNEDNPQGLHEADAALTLEGRRNAQSREARYPPHQEDPADSAGVLPFDESNGITFLALPSQQSAYVVVDTARNEIVTAPFIPSSAPSSYSTPAPPPLPQQKTEEGASSSSFRIQDAAHVIHLAEAMRLYGMQSEGAGGTSAARLSSYIHARRAAAATASVFLWRGNTTASYPSSYDSADHSGCLASESEAIHEREQEPVQRPSLAARLWSALQRQEAGPGSSSQLPQPERGPGLELQQQTMESFELVDSLRPSGVATSRTLSRPEDLQLAVPPPLQLVSSLSRTPSLLQVQENDNGEDTSLPSASPLLRALKFLRAVVLCGFDKELQEHQFVYYHHHDHYHHAGNISMGRGPHPAPSHTPSDYGRQGLQNSTGLGSGVVIAEIVPPPPPDSTRQASRLTYQPGAAMTGNIALV